MKLDNITDKVSVFVNANANIVYTDLPPPVLYILTIY
nr:MAG TPA: hypothetical protein [Caudoviricetes sp.]